MSEQYKLTYFNGRGRAEAIRLLLAYGELSYEDVRIKAEEWLDLKQKMPWGNVPVLEVDGKVIAQSFAIIRYLANKLNLYGTDTFECAKIDEYAYAAEDLRGELLKFTFTQDQQKKEEMKTTLLNTLVPTYMEKFSKITLLPCYKPGPYLFGFKITYADILLANVLDTIETALDSEILNSYPVMKSLKDSVFEIPSIKTYAESRPAFVSL